MNQDIDPIRPIFDRYNWDYDTYLLLSKHNAFDSISAININSPKFGGIHVKRWGRFGNSVTQLSNLAAIAQGYTIPTIYFEEQRPFFDVARLTETTGVPFIYRSRDTFDISDGVILSEIFISIFRIDCFGIANVRKYWMTTYRGFCQMNLRAVIRSWTTKPSQCISARAIFSHCRQPLHGTDNRP
jgi:hypothetical protein